MALSPNGKFLAVAPHPTLDDNGDQSIELYDLFTEGPPTILHATHADRILSLAFSPDGKFIASASKTGSIAVWGVGNSGLVWRVRAHAKPVNVVIFAARGQRVVSVSDDGTVAFWDPNNGMLIRRSSHQTGYMFGLAANPTNSEIATSSLQGRIKIWDSISGAQVKLVAEHNEDVPSLAYSPDGKWLLSGVGTGARNAAVVWDLSTGKIKAEHLDHDRLVFAVAISPDGYLAATGGGSDHAIHLWELASGRLIKTLAGGGQAVWAVGIDSVGEEIAWGHTPSVVDRLDFNLRGPLEYSMRIRATDSNVGEPRKIHGDGRRFERALTQRYEASLGSFFLGAPQLNALGYYSTISLLLNGQPIQRFGMEAPDGFAHISYSLSHDGVHIFSGGENGRLSVYDHSGRMLSPGFKGHESDVQALAPDRVGDFLISGSADQTVRLWNSQTRELVASLLHTRAGDWLMWLPQGYYTGSPGADRMIGWQIPEPGSGETLVIGAEQLRKRFHRPDIVDKAMRLVSAKMAVEQSFGTTFELANLIHRRPPKLRIVAPEPRHSTTRGRAQVVIEASSTSDPIKRVSVLVNDRLIGETIYDLPGRRLALEVPLEHGTNRVSAVASNAVGETVEEIEINNTGRGDLDAAGKLYVVAIGVNKYPNIKGFCKSRGDAACDLQYASQDAVLLKESLSRSLGAQHAATETEFLISEIPGSALDEDVSEPTANNIRDALSRVRNKATQFDTVAIFIAGHGINDGPDYLFLPTNASQDKSGWRGSTVIKWVELESIVFSTLGRRFLFVDTCHSAGAYNAKLGNAAYHNDVTAFVATGQDELSLELAPLQHGAFTFALASGLGSEAAIADLDGDRTVRVKELADFLDWRTSALIEEHTRREDRGNAPSPRVYQARDAVDHVLAKLN